MLSQFQAAKVQKNFSRLADGSEVIRETFAGMEEKPYLRSVLCLYKQQFNNSTINIQWPTDT